MMDLGCSRFDHLTCRNMLFDAGLHMLGESLGKVLVSAHTLPSPPNKLGDLVGMRGFGWST